MKKMVIAAFLAVIMLQVACTKDNGPVAPEEYDNVVIFYSDGYNNLTGDIRENAKTICSGALPMKSDRSALIWVAHNAVSASDFETPVSPVIIRMTSDWCGNAVLDTIKTFEPDNRLVDKDIMSSAFEFIRDEFKSKHYGAVFSSHGTGWLPRDYYRKPTIPRVGAFTVKSFGQSYDGTSSKLNYSYELELPDMAQAIPMHLDYIIFDACLMGGVEVAYELKDCADLIGFSQAEILTTGFDYSMFVQRLLIEKDPVAFCRDYYEFYESGRGSSKSATVSVISTTGLDKLASVCYHLFDKYRSGIDDVDPNDVQGFFTSEKHWFYDLEDLMVQSGISDDDHAIFSETLKGCVLFESHTDNMLGHFDIETSCGLTTFIPSNGSTRLKNYYKTLAWNKVTELVK